jgi:F0F1-type ATP synthase assembly protein I
MVLAGGYIYRIPNPLFLYIVMLTEERPCLKYNTLKIQTD